MAVRKQQTFDEKLQRLQQIVEKLESPDVALEDSVTLYREGRDLAKACREQVEKARHEVRLLGEDGALTAFTPEEDSQ